MTAADIDPDLSDRLPPQALAAERSVLGAALRDNSVVPELAARLADGDFYLDAHRRVFAAVRGLADAGRPVDLVTLFERLRASGEAANVGGGRYLAELYDAAPTAAGWEYHAGIVREKAALRAGLHAATAAAGEFQAGADPIGDAVAEGLADFEQRADPNAPRLTAGFADLDAMIGGFEPGQLVVIGGRPGGGKSALGLALGLNLACLHNVPTLLTSLEMSRKEIVQRAIAFVSGASAHRLRSGKGTDRDWALARRAGADLKGVPLFVRDHPGQRVAHVEAAARRQKRTRGLGLVLIDYLQLLLPDDPRSPRREQVGQISRGLKLAARRLGVPVVAMAQLNREADDRPDGPRLSDLREAGDIEQDADVVLLLWRRPNQPDDADVWSIGCRVAKQRNGPTGDVSLNYRRASMRFEDYAPDVT